MLKILIVALLSCFLSVVSEPIATKNDFNDECLDCVDIPCELVDDKGCRLRSYYEAGSQLISFHLSISSMSSGWIGIVFNNVEFPGMIGSNVVMLELNGENLIAYNGYLKYYNTPFMEDSKVVNLEVKNENGNMIIKFERQVVVESINIQDLKFDLSRCTYVAVATGELIDNLVKQHSDTPKFSQECFYLANQTSNSSSTEINAGIDLDESNTNTTELIITTLPSSTSIPTITTPIPSTTSTTTTLPPTTSSTTTEITTVTTTTTSTTSTTTSTTSTSTSTRTTSTSTTTTPTTTSTTPTTTSTTTTTPILITTTTIPLTTSTTSKSTRSTTTQNLQTTISVITTSKVSQTTSTSTTMNKSSITTSRQVPKPSSDYYYTISMLINQTYTNEFSDPESSEYRELNRNIKSFMKNSLEKEKLNGFYDSNILLISRRMMKRHVTKKTDVANRISTTVLLIYRDIAGLNDIELKDSILKALRNGNTDQFPVEVSSINIKQQEILGKKKSVPLETILLPSIFGAVTLILLIIAIILGYFCYKRGKSYNLYEYPKMEFVNMIRI